MQHLPRQGGLKGMLARAETGLQKVYTHICMSRATTYEPKVLPPLSSESSPCGRELRHLKETTNIERTKPGPPFGRLPRLPISCLQSWAFLNSGYLIGVLIRRASYYLGILCWDGYYLGIYVG